MRIEVTEKYPIQGGNKYDAFWWRENMPSGTTPPDSVQKYRYRRTYLILDTIERPIEIPGNRGECTLRLFSGEDIIIKESYDDFCIRLEDIETRLEEYEDEKYRQLSENVKDE